MLIGIIANITKENVISVVSSFIKELKRNNLEYLLTKSLVEEKDKIKIETDKDFLCDDKEIYEKCDLIISIGGDGTMLTTAYQAQFYEKPVLGLNIGKLGFLAEVDISQIDKIIKDIKNENYQVQERMVITGESVNYSVEKLYAINDIVIDKGGWPKMIEITVLVDGEHVATFSADGVIVATPIGSTGYALSTGGPVVSPSAGAITICPISPHSLTMRPLVLSSSQEIIIKADSLHSEIRISCDGQRVYHIPPPIEIKIVKSEKPLKLIHTSVTTYFQTLRNKLLWGIDVRSNNSDNKIK
ncbi:MAG: NAD(+)/NADH kinase [Bacteroidetes bacterium]|nr:NAD(+)/NADH kinase [Bacteroidota bacterium]MCH7770115.1 NAD(+)/NADH kinase [Bacteroidota bacterium]